MLAAADASWYMQVACAAARVIILKHNNVPDRYAHNQTLLVKEDQAVRKGQKIAEMGNTDAEPRQAAL